MTGALAGTSAFGDTPFVQAAASAADLFEMSIEELGLRAVWTF